MHISEDSELPFRTKDSDVSLVKAVLCCWSWGDEGSTGWRSDSQARACSMKGGVKGKFSLDAPFHRTGSKNRSTRSIKTSCLCCATRSRRQAPAEPLQQSAARRRRRNNVP